MRQPLGGAGCNRSLTFTAAYRAATVKERLPFGAHSHDVQKTWMGRLIETES